MSLRLKLALLIAAAIIVIAAAAALLNLGIHDYPFSVVIALGFVAALIVTYLGNWDPIGWKAAKRAGRSPF